MKVTLPDGSSVTGWNAGERIGKDGMQPFDPQGPDGKKLGVKIEPEGAPVGYWSALKLSSVPAIPWPMT